MAFIIDFILILHQNPQFLLHNLPRRIRDRHDGESKLDEFSTELGIW